MNFIESGILGLDDLLGGGFPEGKSITICGGPGSGKTTFLTQYLIHGATKADQKGLFVLLNQSYLNLVDTCKSIGVDIEKLIAENKIMVIDSSPVQKKHEGGFDLPEWYIMPTDESPNKFKIEELFGKIEYVCHEHGIKRVVVDSATAIRLDFDDEAEFRDEMLRLINILSLRGVTTLFSSETNLDICSNFSISEASLTHGVILLHSKLVDNDRKRYLEVLKLRGINHKIGLKPFTIGQNGIKLNLG